MHQDVAYFEKQELEVYGEKDEEETLTYA